MSSIPERTFNFALEIIKLHQLLEPHAGAARIVSSQLLRSGTSIGANVEEAHGSFSKPDFTYKYSIACKEARETLYWLKLLNASGICNQTIDALILECNEIIAILTTSVKKLKESHD